MTEESLFHQALAKPTAEERSEFLARACADQPQLRSAVEALLAAHEKAGSFLEAPALAVQLDDGAAHDGTSVPTRETHATEPSTNPAKNASAETLDHDNSSRSVLGGPAPVEAPSLPTQIGRYTIRRLLGRGGMGAVYLAHDPHLDRLVALKVPKLAETEAEERFLQEAKAAAAVSHPNLCPVFDTGRADGVLYLAMNYIAGPTLTEVLRDKGPLTPAHAAALVAAIARGMSEAHRHGVVHRDLKPGNILIDRRGEPIVTDFGLALRAALPDASAFTADGARLTQIGVLMGTPAYMPPEQARGDRDRISAASDIYALGVILFELLTGKLPFPVTSLGEMVRQIEEKPAPPPSSLRPDIPRGLDAVCEKALAKDPLQRFATMDEFAAALTPFLHAPKTRWRLAALSAAAAALLLAFVGVIFYLRTDHGVVEVRLSDPRADVKIAVDGNEIVLKEDGRITRLSAGPHGLEVKGPNFETVTRLFKVTRGATTVLEIELKPKMKLAANPPPPPLEKKKKETPSHEKKTPDTPPPMKEVKKDPDPAPSPRDRLAELLAQGEKLVREAQYADLRVLAEAALKLDPESPTALAYRATSQVNTGEPRLAKTDVDAALRLNPLCFQAVVVRGFLHMAEGKSDEAIADMTIAIHVRPSVSLSWSNRAAAYWQRKEYRQVIADATRGIELGDQRSSPYLNRAAAYTFLGDYDKALADFTAAISIVPDDPLAYLQRSAVHAKVGKMMEADDDWTRATKLAKTKLSRPTIPAPPKTAGGNKLSLQQANALQDALARHNLAWDRSAIPEAKIAADEACKIDPTSAAARAANARVLGVEGRFEACVKEASEAIRLDPSYAPAYVTRGVAATKLKRLADSIADLTIAIQLDPGDYLAFTNRGWSYHERGDFHMAAADLTEAIRLKPAYLQSYTNRGSCYIYTGEYDKAVADYTKVIEARPTEPKWRRIRAALRARLGDTLGAKADRDAAIALDQRLANAPEIALPVPLPVPRQDP